MNLSTLSRCSDQDNSYNIKDDSREPHQGTPNDVRMFPVKTASSSQVSSSQSIPIANVEMSQSELQLHEDEALAEMREYRMYQRIVTGMKAKSLDSEPLEARTGKHSSAPESLHNLLLGRHSRFVPEQQYHQHLGIAARDMQMAYNSSYATTTAYTYTHMMMPPDFGEVTNHDGFLQEDEGIFELEL
jgi:hypothetical protein